MDSRRLVFSLSVAIIFVSLAESWLLASGVTVLSPNRLFSGGDTVPPCNRSDYLTRQCEVHPMAPVGSSCDDQWFEAIILPGNSLDVLEGDTAVEQCTANLCRNIWKPEVIEGGGGVACVTQGSAIDLGQ